MLIQILLFLFLGIFTGIITGLIPGLHINLVGIFLVYLSLNVLSSLNSIYFVVFISSMTITHIFIDFIPSVFLGCPKEDTELSVLPGHELLKQGKGYEAVVLTTHGCLIGIFLLILSAYPLLKFISTIYNSIKFLIPYILITVLLIMVFTEKNKLSAFFVFLLSGALGLSVLNMNVKEPLLPLLSGLFGSSTILLSIKDKVKIPKQLVTLPKITLKKPIIGALIASPLCGFLPGLGAGQATIVGNTIAKTDRRGFLVLLGITNTFVMGISFLSIYAISKTRTGAAAAIQKLIGNMEFNILILILIISLISAIISFFITKKIAKIFSEKIMEINYTILSIITLIILVAIVLFVSGIFGFVVLTVSTLTGIYCISLNVKRTNMMGCLLLPTIILYLI